MSDYKRNFVAGGTYFFTINSFNKQKFFTSPVFRSALRKATSHTKQKLPFEINAWVLLPDHLHCIWTLPENDHNYSARWSMIKCMVTQQCKYHFLQHHLSNPSRFKRNESTIWQRRFWEHTITNEYDYENHLNYIYWDPVKHGYSGSVNEWPFSTFHRDVKKGLYDEKWVCDLKESIDVNFGE